MKTILAILCLCSPLSAATDAMTELNNQRGRVGLFPFIEDAGLTQGAMKCADYRASWGMAGHTGDDFKFLPPGCMHMMSNGWMQEKGGAGVSSTGFSACYANYPQMLPKEQPHGGIPGVVGNNIYAGAAVAYDNRGQRYCSLFVSGSPSRMFHPIEAVVRATREILAPRFEQAPIPVEVAPQQAYNAAQQVTPSSGQVRQGILGRLRSRFKRSGGG